MSKSNNAVFVQEEVVLSKIFLIRGRKVMLDRDLAFLYGVKAIRLREQVKRNSERFPETFMFQLTEDEVDFMVSQNAIPSKKHLGGYLPFVFTEYGVLMLANVIKSEQARLLLSDFKCLDNFFEHIIIFNNLLDITSIF